MSYVRLSLRVQTFGNDITCTVLQQHDAIQLCLAQDSNNRHFTCVYTRFSNVSS
jgi:hypothetical protein